MVTLRHRFAILALLVAALVQAGPLSAQTAFLVDDLEHFEFTNGSSLPTFRFKIGDRAVFSAYDGTASQGKVWSTDGTAAGTEELPGLSPEATPRGVLLGKTLLVGPRPGNPDARPRLALWLSDGTAAGTERLAPREMNLTLAADRTAGDAFYFFADDPAGETSTLWVLEGSAAGFHPVATLGARTPSAALVAGERLFFLASEERIPLQCGPPDPCDRSIRWRLWVSDGTAGGTRPIADAGTAPLYTPAAALHHATSEGVYFSVTDLQAGRSRLSFTRGRGGPPRQLAEYSGSGGLSLLPRFLEDGDGVIFVAAGQRAGLELWRSNGTAAGTRRVSDLPSPFPFTSEVLPAQIARLEDQIILAARDAGGGLELWSVEPRSRSTVQLTNLGPDEAGTFDTRSNLVVRNGRVLFTALERSGRRALWQTDGTPAGTGPLFDPGSSLADDLSLNLIEDGGSVFFTASTAAGGQEVFALAPADLAPRTLTAFVPTEPLGFVLSGLRLGNRFLFAAFGDAHGLEPWSTSITPNPTAARLISDLAVGNGPSSNPVGLTRLGDRALYFACQEATVGLFATTGHPGSTRRLHTLTTDCSHFTTQPPNESPPPIALAAGLAFHRADRDATIWRSDGTPEGTFVLASFPPSQVFGPVAVGDHIVFLRTTGVPGTGTLGYEVWQSDGTLAGTVLKSTLRGVGLVGQLYGGEDRFYWSGSYAGFAALTASDGTQAGTQLLLRTGPGQRAKFDFSFFEGLHFVRFLGRDYFGWNGQLWRTDGTTAGTESLEGLFPGPRSSFAIGITPRNGALYLFGSVGTNDGIPGLWRTDGTAAGTELLAPLPGSSVANLGPPVIYGDRLAFITATAADGIFNRQLWFSDGTAAGTAPLPVELGDLDFASCELAFFNGKLYFAAGSSFTDLELWQSDGSAAGTHLAQEIAPGEGPVRSDPRSFVPLADRLLFAADDGFFGREVWALPAGPGGCQPQPHKLCLREGRFQAEVLFQDPAGHSFAGEAAPQTAEAGAFSFFRSGNLDLFLKVLDGSAVNGRGWVFVGSLSNASFTLTLTDTETGAARRYTNLYGKMASFADTGAFDLRGALLAGDVALPAPNGFSTKASSHDKRGAGTCAPAAERLCLLGGRFAAEIDWRTATAQGHATMVPASDTSGTFWFFRPDNLEGAVKMIDGTAVNGHAWFFFTGLTNLELTIRIRDTTNGALRTYTKARGRFAAFADVGAL